MEIYLVTTLILCGIVASGSGQNCIWNPSNVMFPINEVLLTRAAFDSMISKNALLGQVEFALPYPPSFYPDPNFYCKIVKVDKDVYQRNCTSGFRGSMCLFYPASLNTLNPEQNRAIYSYQYYGIEMTEAYWSKDPTKYIWRIQCQGYDIFRNVCAVANVRLSLFVFNKDQYDKNVKDTSKIDLENTICVNYWNDLRFQWFLLYLREPCG
ncbi:uncharacterized protein LOC132718137 [Ruditapes philippinarum]|uniref:uncharacterized protein LOC132718137 n=1 Tax=Ruditapes philippinarum TaxID=129788 RepID=UPI00295AD1E5|nr:uncharacterized protein LOC132718137 [Ruditapes philippinarum]